MMRIVLDARRGHVLRSDAHGMLVALDGPANQYLLDAADSGRAVELAALCTGPDRVVSLMDARYAPLLGAREQDIFRCNTYVYHGGSKPDVVGGANGPARVGALELRALDEGALDVVCAHYAPLPPEAVRHHLHAGWVFGGFDATGELVGFVGEHDEGSIGMLEVLPAHRRRGYAQALESFMINRHLAQGHTPYCQVEMANAASHALQAKLGFTRLPGVQCWIEG